MTQLATILHDGRRTVVGPDGVTIGRDGGNAVVVRSERASRHHARVLAVDGGFAVEDLGSRNGTMVNGERFTAEMRPLANGDTIVVGGEVLRVLTGQETRPASRSMPIVGTQVIGFTGDRLRVGRDASNDVVLVDPNVSRFHAEVIATERGHELRDLGSRNGTRLDGRRVARGLLRPGSGVGIGPFRLIFDGSGFLARDDRGRMHLDAERIAVEIKGKQILAPTSLSIGPGDFIAIIGESGAGKSTLIKALAGVAPPTDGTVAISGEPVANRLTDIGYVPQDDIVHRLLTVREALRYAARLRLPQDSSRDEIDDAVARVLGELDLNGHEGTRVGSLSGGQRKRAGVAAELLSRPSLLFLDEPTTGLDPGLETRLMELLRTLADDSRAVTVVTHATKNLALCDKLVVMARGGELAYSGSPEETLGFFGADAPDEIYTALQDRSAGSWHRRFQAEVAAEDKVATLVDDGSAAGAGVADTSVAERRVLRQTAVLAHRYARLLLRDRRNLLLLLGQVPLLAALITALFSPGAFDQGRSANDGIQLLFLLMITTVWLGSVDASREIIKERSVFVRERAVGMRLSAYLLSKAVVLAVLVALQTVVLAAVVALSHPLHETAGTYLTVLAILLLTGFASIGMGLLISAVAKSEDQATSFIPLALLPQLLFAGLIVPVEQMTAAVEKLSALIFTRWGFAGSGSVLDMNDRLARDSRLSRSNEYGTSFFDLSPLASGGILVAFLAAFFGLVALLLRRRRA